MEHIHFWNLEFNHNKIHGLTGDVNYITRYIINLTKEYLDSKHFSGNVYLRVLAYIKVAQKYIQQLRIGKVYKYIGRKEVISTNYSFDNSKLKVAINNFLYFNGEITFKREDFNGQIISTDDIDYEAIQKIGRVFNIVPSTSTKHNMFTGHFQLDTYKNIVNDLFEEIVRWQSEFTPAIQKVLFQYIRDEVIKESLRNRKLKYKTFFYEPTIKTIPLKEPQNNLHFFEGKYLYIITQREPSFVKSKYEFIDSPIRTIHIQNVLDIVQQEYKVIFNINPNALLFFSDITKPVLESSRIDYFNFVSTYQIYDFIYSSMY